MDSEEINNLFYDIITGNIHFFSTTVTLNSSLGSFLSFSNPLQTYVRVLTSNNFNFNFSRLLIERMLYNCTIEVPYLTNQRILAGFNNFLIKHKTLSTVPIPLNINNYDVSSSSSSDYEEEGSIASLYSSPFSNFNKLFYKKFPSSVFLKSSYTYSSIEDQYFIREELTFLEIKSLEYEKMNNDLTALKAKKEKLGSEVNKESSVLVNQRFKNQSLSRSFPVEKNNKGYIENLLKCRESFKVNDEKIEKLKKLDLLIKQKEEEIVTYSSKLEEEKLKLYCKINNEAKKQFNKRISNGSIRRITDVNEKWIIDVNRKSFTNSFMYNNFYKDYPKQNIMEITS